MTRSEGIELKPCPFCKYNGGSVAWDPANLLVRQNRSFGQFYVGCGSCGARGPLAASSRDAELAWNRRAVEYHDDAEELEIVGTWLDSARFDGRLTQEERDACDVVLNTVARLQEGDE